MEYTYETYKYDAAERQAKAIRKQSGNRNQENRGKQSRRRR